MNVDKKLSGTELLVVVEGKLDTMTAPQLEQELKAGYGGVTKLVLDFKKLEYISSAGLRVVLSAHKTMNGNMIVKHVNESVMEVFELTGFADILNIE